MSNMIVPGIDPGSKRNLWIPGMGDVPTDIREVSEAVEQYDTRLSLGRDERTGDWVVLREGGPEGIPFFPVMGLGAILPGVDEVKKILFSRDVARNGSRIVNQVVARQESRRKAAHDRADDATSVAAEAMEWGYRKMGGSNANAKVFIKSKEG